jgi:3-methyladenine DNA glycosylase/8-oxoguanine DNA glycosylase
VARHGRPVGGLAEVGLTHVFPTSTVLADPRTTFDGLGLPTHVVHAVRALAAAVEVDVLRTDRSQPLDDALHAAAAAGVERQVAQQIAWRLGEPDVFPSGDQTVERAAARLVGDEVSDQPLDVLSRRWSPNRSLAALHLGPTPG